MPSILDYLQGYPPQPAPIQNMGYDPEEEQINQSLGNPKTISGRIQEFLGAREPNQAGMAQNILLGRFQPTFDDSATGAVQTLLGGKPVSGQNIADERMKNMVDQLSALSRAEYLSKGGGSGSVFAQTMEAINQDPELANLSMMDKIRLAQNKLGTNLTMGPNGVSAMTGAPEALGNLAYGEKKGGELGQKEVDLQFNPLIAGAETQQRNAADITAAAPLAAEKVKGEKQGQATTNLPVIEQNTAYAQNILKNIVTHPGLEADVGLRSYLPVVRGTDRANFRSLRNQINGTAFLQAFQTLRGGGQISNVEGDKATSAITRLNDPNIDKESFVQAANELYNILDVGLQRARGEAQGNFNQNFSSEEFSKVNPGFNLPVSGNGSFTNDTGIPTDQARQAPDGNFYIPDPNRPGKYLMVQP